MLRLLTTMTALAGIGLAAPALAHVTAHPAAGPAGAYFEAAFNVPHGCDGSATIALRIKIPPEVTGVKPQLKAGWTTTIKIRKLDKPITNEHGHAITEVADEIDYVGGPLPDTMFDSFALMMKLPETPGATLYFPVVQECQQGVHRWIEIPGPGQTRAQLREPAPIITLTPKAQ